MRCVALSQLQFLDQNGCPVPSETQTDMKKEKLDIGVNWTTGGSVCFIVL